MKTVFLREEEINDNIKMINYYAGEEKKILNKICTELVDTKNSYQSNHVSKVVELSNDLKNKIPNLYKKRLEYREILEKAKLRYKKVEHEVSNYFGGEES